MMKRYLMYRATVEGLDVDLNVFEEFAFYAPLVPIHKSGVDCGAHTLALSQLRSSHERLDSYVECFSEDQLLGLCLEWHQVLNFLFDAAVSPDTPAPQCAALPSSQAPGANHSNSKTPFDVTVVPRMRQVNDVCAGKRASPIKKTLSGMS